MIKGNQKGKGTAKQVASYVPKKNRCDVFLSYRRADGRDLTGRIKDKLALKLLSVFYDYDSLKDGKFNLKIIDAIYSCDDFVLVMTPRIFENCTDENNWIMLEIRTAIKYNKHIIPVFVEDTDEKVHALNMVMKHQTGKEDWEYDPRWINAVCIIKVELDEYCVKQHKAGMRR